MKRIRRSKPGFSVLDPDRALFSEDELMAELHVLQAEIGDQPGRQLPDGAADALFDDEDPDE